jgi:hypothetical protein
MALFFDINKLEEQSGNDTKLFLNMLYFHWNKAIPLNKSNKFLRSKVSLIGNSYLLNPQDLFSDQFTDELFKVQYIKLAGRRDYSLYRMHKYCRLPTSYFPDLIYDSIKHNPLLEITQKEILFKYEER